MALSPVPVVAVVLVLAGPKARANGPAFAAGWIAGLAAVSVVVVLVAGGASEQGSDAATGVDWMTLAIGVLFLAMAAQQWKKRPRAGETPKMPDWMTSVSSISAPRALVLGAALSGANPKNVALTLAASASIASSGLDGGDTALAIAVFVAIGSITVVGAVVVHAVAPERAERPLDAVRTFMADNGATIMMVVLLLLAAKFLGDGLAGLWS